MGCSLIFGAAIPGFFLSSWFAMLLWGVIADRLAIPTTLSYVYAMLVTIRLWIVVAPLAAAAKVFASELMQRVTFTGCDIMGLYGQVEASRWAPLHGAFATNYQTTMGINFAGGTSEVMRNLVSSMGCGLPRSW